MEEVGFPREGGSVAVMLMEHEQGRAYVKSFSAALDRVRSGDSAARWKILKNKFDRV